MSVLMDILKEELDRLDRQQAAYERDLAELPKGYISKKVIRGRESYYWQYRDGQKIVSQYISAAELPEKEWQLKRRKSLEVSLRRVHEDRKRLKRVLK